MVSATYLAISGSADSRNSSQSLAELSFRPGSQETRKPGNQSSCNSNHFLPRRNPSRYREWAYTKYLRYRRLSPLGEEQLEFRPGSNISCSPCPTSSALTSSVTVSHADTRRKMDILASSTTRNASTSARSSSTCSLLSLIRLYQM
jgi:hypothetical protein